MRACLAGGQQWGSSWLDCDGLDGFLLLFEVLRGARDRATCADTGNHNVDLPISVVPNLGAGGLVVDLRVGFIFELAGQDCVFRRLDDLVRLIDGPLHACRAWRQYDLCPVRAKDHATLLRHCLRHGQDDFVALRSAGERECDAGVARCRFHDGAAWLQFAGGFRRADDSVTNTVLDGICRVVKLKFC